MKRDDIIEYSLYNHHTEEEGKQIRKKIYFVTLLLSVITAIEVLMGIFWGKAHLDPEGWAWTSVKIAFILMTIIKAGYIVMVFMHLGDERKSLKWVILAPYLVFILYIIYILLMEGVALHDIRTMFEWS